jgi:hypothetical protein
MKRDMDLIRQLLLDIEGDRPCIPKDGFDEDTVAKHFELLVEAGLIKGTVHENDQQGVYRVDVDRLTWQGYEFLDSARNEEMWDKARTVAAKSTGSISFEVLKTVLVAFSKVLLKQAGVPLP